MNAVPFVSLTRADQFSIKMQKKRLTTVRNWVTSRGKVTAEHNLKKKGKAKKKHCPSTRLPHKNACTNGDWAHSCFSFCHSMTTTGKKKKNETTRNKSARSNWLATGFTVGKTQQAEIAPPISRIFPLFYHLFFSLFFADCSHCLIRFSCSLSRLTGVRVSPSFAFFF